MKLFFARPFSGRLLAVLALALAACGAGPALAGGGTDKPVKYRAQLVWGTNGQQPDRPLKAVSPELREFLGRVFKWRDYWEVSVKTAEIPAHGMAALDMSEECRLEIRRLESHEVEVQLVGKGRQVFKQRQKLPPGEKFIVGGDSKLENAWFVVVTAEDPKAKARPAAGP